MTFFDNHGVEEVEVPMGLAMALANNEPAFHYFASLTTEQKKTIIDQTHSIQSKQEMRSFVDHLVVQ